ncbi:MAG: LamG-like jellyroll fold domain-containing protein [bacterium]
MKKIFQNISGFSLIELLVAIVVIGIILSLAMQSMDTVVDDNRRVTTKREMDKLAQAIVGNPDIANTGVRSDFGYIGDNGTFPSSLQELYSNTNGWSTWDGPYITTGITQDTVGLKYDEWNQPYNYTGGIIITSTGSGSTITKKIADSPSDYLLNSFNGVIKDSQDSLPGNIYKDSIEIEITIPNGSGSLVTKIYNPASDGNFTLDSLPVGQHQLEIIYSPENDTLTRYLTILPRHKSNVVTFNFGSSYFSTGGGGGGGSEPEEPPNLVGHWKLDDTSGTIAYDYSGYGNNGTLTNMTGNEWTTGKIGGALEFDGTNDEVIIADADILDDTEQLTMSVWVYAHTLDNNPRGPLSKRVSHTGNYSYSMFFYNSDLLNVDINTQDNRFSCPLTFQEDQWYHIAVIYDGTLTAANRVSVYVDGTLIHTAYETSSAIANTSSPLVIGQLYGNSLGYFDGLIDDVRLYNRALTPSEIQDLYNLGS